MATNRNPKKKLALVTHLRWGILLVFLAIMMYTSYLHIKIGGGPNGYPTVDAICPLGGVETFYKYLTTGNFISYVAISSIILMASLLLMALVSRRAFCSWLCPFGGLQEWFGALGRKLLGNRHLTIPASLDRPLRYLKYIILALIVYFTWYSANLVFRPYDPWVALMHLWDGPQILQTFPIGVAVLIIVLIGSFLFDRFFCKYLCPLGALMALVSMPGVLTVKRDTDKCINCHICSRVCPMNVRVDNTSVVNDPECINCMDCQANCPVQGALVVGSRWQPWTGRSMSPLVLAGTVLFIFLGSYGLARTADIWQSSSGGLVVRDLDPVKKVNQVDVNYQPVEDIKGFNSLEEVSKAYQIPKAELYKVIKIPDSVPESTKLKELKNIKGLESVETEIIRDEVSKILEERKKG